MYAHPMLISTPALDSADQVVLDGIEAFRRDFKHRVAEPRRWIGHLRRSLTAGAIRGSTTIEGYTISADDAEALAAHEEMSAAVSAETAAAVEGYRDALTYVQQAANFEDFRYDKMLFSALHFMMTKTVLSKWPGRFRTAGVWVTAGAGLPPAYTAPDADAVPPLMDELVAWLNEGDLDTPMYVRAAMAHLNLVSVHPWRDGNGRMSRCLHTLVLAREGILAPEFSSIEEWLGLGGHNTGLYYAALATTREVFDPSVDAHEWVKFCLRTHHLQAQLVQRRLEVAKVLWSKLELVAQHADLDPRTVTALYAAAQGELRRTTYQSDEALTRDQAVRDLQTLGKLRLIEPVGHGRTSRYIAGESVRRFAVEIRESVNMAPLREPYSGS